MRATPSLAVTSALLASVLLATPAPTHAEDQLLRGRRLLMRAGGSAERLLLLSRDAIFVPGVGGPDDPTIVGGSLEIENVSTGETTTFSMPAGNFSVNGRGTRFKFVNPAAPSGSEVRRAILASGRVLRVTAVSTGVPIDGSAPGQFRLVLSLGSRRYCLFFNDEAEVRYRPGRRLVARFAPPPDSCEASSPSGAFLTRRAASLF